MDVLCGLLLVHLHDVSSKQLPSLFLLHHSSSQKTIIVK
jgi:hypothetical protein